jgi:hypothetical protein
MSSADSAGSTTALLPRVTAPVPPLRKVTPTASPPTRDLDLTKTALGAEHKSVLVKRNRKLEKVLGQALSEETVERFVVEPAVASSGSHGSCGSCGSHDNEGGDSTQSSHDVPEWMRHDIDPQLVPVPVDAGESTGSYRSRLRFGASASSTPPELKVYVSRVRHVAETRVGAGTVQPVRSATGRVMAKAAVSASPSATDTTTDTTAATTATKTTTAPAPTPTVLSPPLPSPHPSFSSANSSLDAEIKDARRIHRARRIQLAKVSQANPLHSI